VGVPLQFRAEIDNIESNQTIEVKIDSGNYANIKLKEALPVNYVTGLNKGQIIEFAAEIESFGTGILVKHKLTNAQLTKIEPMTMEKTSN
jgi:hypothetical protein